ncbi:MAG: PaaI family thioesterase [Acidobacteria bacterium]|nr:PaaI family thioesterase [Acidobacteriota bacterium]
MPTDSSNPYPAVPSRCFACGPQNPKGLHLHFERTPELAVTAAWTPLPDFDGYPGLTHGGIVATVLDEAMSKAVAVHAWRALTCDLSVRLRHTIRSGCAYRVTGRVLSRRKRRILTEAVIHDAQGRECAFASAVFLAPVESSAV